MSENRNTLISRMTAWFRGLGPNFPSNPNAEESFISGSPDDGGSRSSDHDPYRGVIIVLTGTTFLGAFCAATGGLMFSNQVLLDEAMTLLLSSGMLLGVALTQALRAGAFGGNGPGSVPTTKIEVDAPSDALSKDKEAKSNQTSPLSAPEGANEATELVANDKKGNISKPPSGLPAVAHDFGNWLRELGIIEKISLGTATIGLFTMCLLEWLLSPRVAPSPLASIVTFGLCAAAAGLAATGAHYLSTGETRWLPEGPALCRLARVLSWTLLFAAASVLMQSAGQYTLLSILHDVILAINFALCFGLLGVTKSKNDSVSVYPVDFGILKFLGSRANIVASIIDSVERQFGIDLRSTWALAVVRSSLEPLIIVLSLIGWLSTSLTIIGIQEQGLMERFGIPVGQQLNPGIHIHWPWPIDQVYRVPMQRVHALEVGHEGEEGGGPEDVLWAVEHAPNEYTLLLGNGRDLITVDAAVQYRITDIRAWRYRSQNPAETLRAIAYRAVMRSTVNRTLSQTLSENLATLTEEMRKMVQDDASDLGLGVDIVGITVGGMHPPVPVAADYEAVVSAELGMTTSVVKAQAFRNQTVPAARAAVLVEENKARATGLQDLAVAAGEAWSFRTLETQYRAAPAEYFFRRRLEALETGLTDRRFMILDSRFERDGGELWVGK